MKVKCKLCECIIDADPKDILICDCKEITVDGIGMKVIAKHGENLIMLDKPDTSDLPEIQKQTPLIIESTHHNPQTALETPKLIALDLLDEMIINIEGLPQHAMILPISHYDWLSLLLVIKTVLRSID
jgi:hypothetical protein